MESIEAKSLSLLRILQILQRHSDNNHPLTQKQIADYLDREYGIIIERKAISRKVQLLKDALEPDGVYIETGRGTYLDTRIIEDSELRMLIDGVLSSKYITSNHSKQLIEKLCKLTSEHFASHIKNVYSVTDWSKTDNCALFLNIELVDEAIERGKQIKFNYNKYGMDKKLHRSATHIVSPYQLILHNQRYFLMALNEKRSSMTNYRLDHITDMEIIEDSALTDIRTVPGYEKGIDYKELASSRPYMFADKAENVTFLCDMAIIDQVIDWFGYSVKFTKHDDTRAKATVRVSLNAMEYWAMQYLNRVEILSPDSLRDRIKANLNKAVEKYNS